MTITRDNDFLVNTDKDGRLSVGMESGCLDACIAEVAKRDAVGVFGSPGFGFEEDNLDFLRQMPSLERIWFWDVALRDTQGVYYLEDLRFFGVHPKRPAINFRELYALEEIVWHHIPQDTGIDSLDALRLLHVWHCNPKHRTFDGIPLPLGFSELQINWANPRSLVGLPPLHKLKRLEIHRCRNLESIGELTRITPNLEHLVVGACGRVSDVPDVVQHLPRLRHAFVHDQVLVST